MTTVSAYEQGERSSISTYFQIDDSWKQRSGKGVSVAIIDSGLAAAHADLK
jgi:subtilisin family serine protease